MTPRTPQKYLSADFSAAPHHEGRRGGTENPRICLLSCVKLLISERFLWRVALQTARVALQTARVEFSCFFASFLSFSLFFKEIQRKKEEERVRGFIRKAYVKCAGSDLLRRFFRAVSRREKSFIFNDYQVYGWRCAGARVVLPLPSWSCYA